MNTTQRGNLGEKIACRYLRREGYRVVGRNYKAKYGEIDVIAQDTVTGILVFVEVKTMFSNRDSFKNLVPEDNLSIAKLNKLQKISQFFANASPELLTDSGWRIDLIAVSVRDGGKCKLRHYKNIQ